MTPGRDAVLRCEAQVPDVSFLLLRAGEEEPSAVTWSTHRSADLVLTYVGPQHAGTYSCRYRTGGPRSLLSELSDPVELRVAGELKAQEEGVAVQAFAPMVPSSRAALSCTPPALTLAGGPRLLGGVCVRAHTPRLLGGGVCTRAHT